MSPERDAPPAVGVSIPRTDGYAKVTGAAEYAADVRPPGRWLWAKVLRSPLPHARIVRIDATRARRCPGVHAVLTGADVAGRLLGRRIKDAPVLAQDVVRFVGDPVVAVAALTEDQAADACSAVTIEYEPLATISSVDEAIETSEPLIHDYGDEGNLHKKISLQFGAVDDGFAQADEIFEDVMFYEGSTHLPMEQHAAVAVPEGGGRITLYTSTQTPHYVHKVLATVLGMPASRVRVIACSVGGGFGGKSDIFSHEIVAAKMALVTGRPVKICLNREEVFYCHRGRHPVLMHLRTGFTKDGAMVAQHLKTALDGGAYGSYGVASTYYTGALQTVTYGLPRYRFDSIRAFTNKPPCGPKRGHATVQPRFALEVHLDKAAQRLGIDPADLRLNNLLPPDSITANYLKVGTI
ncbi:MAG: molybdopterin-dependent oxidoreductase, partial [Chloroflexi bacterium]|nr:molybdopterin-dependent oxidoreductase [Chloroflexota bacterium]